MNRGFKGPHPLGLGSSKTMIFPCHKNPMTSCFAVKGLIHKDPPAVPLMISPNYWGARLSRGDWCTVGWMRNMCVVPSKSWIDWCLKHYIIIPVVPHKAVAEVSKNRKPIGEVGCCESGMAERSHWWIERWLISLTLSLSFSLSFFLFLWLSTYLPIYLSIYLSIFRSN